jgi:hypothetical protein
MVSFSIMTPSIMLRPDMNVVCEDHMTFSVMISDNFSKDFEADIEEANWSVVLYFHHISIFW